MTKLTNEERETIICFNAADRETVHVFSDDPVWMRKLERAGAVVTKEHPSGGKEYSLERRQVSIRKLAGKKVMSDEQRQKARERMHKMLEAKRTATEQ